ncbi:MAG: hypothetical protein RLZZ387_2570 [Chloroflexota bacterium]|jgi:hypothetical protein
MNFNINPALLQQASAQQALAQQALAQQAATQQAAAQQAAAPSLAVQPTMQAMQTAAPMGGSSDFSLKPTTAATLAPQPAAMAAQPFAMPAPSLPAPSLPAPSLAAQPTAAIGETANALRVYTPANLQTATTPPMPTPMMSTTAAQPAAPQAGVPVPGGTRFSLLPKPAAPAGAGVPVPGGQSFALPPKAPTSALPTTPPANYNTMFGGFALPPEYAQQIQQRQADYAAKNTYTMTRPTSGLSAANLDFQLRDGQQGFQFVTNKGNAAGVGKKAAGTKGAAGYVNESGFVPLVDNAVYRIRNEKGKDQILYSGTGAEGLKNVYAYAQNLSATKGKKANWGVEMQLPGETGWRRVADDDPAKGTLSKIGKIVGTALPLGVAFIPGLNALGAIAAATAAGGAGAAMAGRNPLKGAIMGGLSAAGGSLLGPALNVGSKAASTAIGTGIGATAGGLATGQSLQNSLIGGVTAGGLSALGSELGIGRKPGAATGNGGPANLLEGTPFNGIATTPAGGLVGSSGLGGAGGSSASWDGDQIAITAIKSPGGTTGGAPGGVTGGLTTGGSKPATYDEATDELKITADKKPEPIPGAGAMFGASPELQQAVKDAVDNDPKNKDKSTTEKMADYLQLASLVIGLGGSLFEKDKTNKPGKIPFGFGPGGLGGPFAGGLPAPSMPGLKPGGSLAARPMTDTDWYRYGYGPEQSFFEHVAPGAANTSRAYTGYATGGFAVGGPGDGRDDKIPAMLSDGEYVIDAETVALLGNGSSKAGADALDVFRTNIRKHKGQKLAKGNFSVNAKKPEKYLKKGRN